MKKIPLTTFALIASALFFAGCSTNTGDATADRRGRVTNAVLEETFNSVLAFGLNQGASLIAGQNGQDAAHAIFTAANQGVLSSGGINHIVSAWAGPEVGSVVAAKMQEANPQTPADKVLVANTIGAAIQIAANQLAG